jgi:signal transduction histidine kinase
LAAKAGLSSENRKEDLDALSAYGEQMKAVIRVTNELIDPLTLDGDIFQRNKRGVDSTYEGSGLGLYIVRKVAKMHKGDLGYRLVNRNQVIFEFAIPA